MAEPSVWASAPPRVRAKSRPSHRSGARLIVRRTPWRRPERRQQGQRGTIFNRHRRHPRCAMRPCPALVVALHLALSLSAFSFLCRLFYHENHGTSLQYQFTMCYGEGQGSCGVMAEPKRRASSKVHSSSAAARGGRRTQQSPAASTAPTRKSASSEHPAPQHPPPAGPPECSPDSNL